MDISLIVNADDFGRTRDINRGILYAFQHGIVTGASLMTNFDAFAEAVHMALHHNLPVGVHFNLTEGRPVSEAAGVASLVDSQGRFFKKNTFILHLLQGRIREQDVRTELYAQMLKCVEAGVKPDHYDSHHHIHVLPMIGRLCRDCAGAFGIEHARRISKPPRGQSLRSCAQQWLVHFADARLATDSRSPAFWGFDLMARRDKRAVLCDTLKLLSPGRHELMCHPGFLSEENIGYYNLPRFDELQALCHESVREQVSDCHINLLSFKDLPIVYEN